MVHVVAQLAWVQSCAAQRIPAVPSSIIKEKNTNLSVENS
jgi:hypothetical protein